MTCICGARIARGYGGRLVHMTAPVGPPHYAIAKVPASREAVALSPRRSTASPAAGRSGISSGGH